MEASESESAPAVECGTCGRVGGPVPTCEICHGNGRIQERRFSRSEEIRGEGGDTSRYSRTGDVSPKIVQLPGSFRPDQG
jgi:hypothetical protein